MNKDYFIRNGKVHMAKEIYEVVSPIGKCSGQPKVLAHSLEDLSNKKIGMFLATHDEVRGGVVFQKLQELLQNRFPNATFIPCAKFPKWSDNMKEFIDSVRMQGCDAVITGYGGGNYAGRLAFINGNIETALGIPTVFIVGQGFVNAASSGAESVGLPGLRLAICPGDFELDSTIELEKKSEGVLFPEIIAALTGSIEEEAGLPTGPEPREIVFAGDLEEVNTYFLDKQWGDGLPIVPPTLERVEEFLRYTDAPSEEVIGIMPLANLEASVWKIAVNGVMAGCRPEYMSVLMAITEALADSRFGETGSTSGWVPMVTLNGPIGRDLNFCTSMGVLLPGNQANTSVGRFVSLILRNVGRMLPASSDGASFGRNFFIVLAEDETHSPWEPLSITRGFQRGDSVVTLTGASLVSLHLKAMGNSAEDLLAGLAASLKRILLSGDLQACMRFGPEVSYQLIMTPMVAKRIASAGYSKRDVQEYLYQHSMVPAHEFDSVLSLQTGGLTSCHFVKAGMAKAIFCESTDPERMVPLYNVPDELQIIVSGDPLKNRFFITQQMGSQGYATSKKVSLPSEWQKLIKAH
jgi:hypothetical protein